MSAGIPGWTPEIERSFKEILFRFLEEIQCTKAAVYLLGPNGSYLLATQYGFGRRDLISTEHRPHDPLVAQLEGLGGEPRASTTRRPSTNSVTIFETGEPAGSFSLR